MSRRPLTCGECAAPLHDDQRYCLRCGARFGAPRVDPLVALGFEPDVPPVVAAPAAAGGDEPLPVGRRAPSRRTTAALAAATLVLGGLAGAALGPGPSPSIAAAPSRQVVALVVPQAAPAATTTTTDAAPEPPDDEGSSDTPRARHATASTTTEDDSSASDTTTPAASDDDTTTPASSTAPASSTTPGDTSTTPLAGTAPAHLWVISLPASDEPTAFGPTSPLADLVPDGALLNGYAPAAPSEAANTIALLGGQVPAADCAADLAACVLPAGEPSLPDQVVSLNLTWRAYVEDATQRCTTGPSPRVGPSLFTTLLQRGDCATTVVGPDALPADLKTVAKTPALSLVVVGTTATARALVNRITASDAYKKDGVVVLAPDAPPPATPTAPLGALVLSPRATAGTVVATPTGPVALLRSLDQLLGLDPLGAAAQASPGALDGVLKDFPPSTQTTTTRRSP